jgi:hypothetical protein
LKLFLRMIDVQMKNYFVLLFNFVIFTCVKNFKLIFSAFFSHLRITFRKYSTNGRRSTTRFGQKWSCSSGIVVWQKLMLVRPCWRWMAPMMDLMEWGEWFDFYPLAAKCAAISLRKTSAIHATTLLCESFCLLIVTQSLLSL